MPILNPCVARDRNFVTLLRKIRDSWKVVREAWIFQDYIEKHVTLETWFLLILFLPCCATPIPVCPTHWQKIAVSETNWNMGIQRATTNGTMATAPEWRWTSIMTQRLTAKRRDIFSMVIRFPSFFSNTEILLFHLKVLNGFQRPCRIFGTFSFFLTSLKPLFSFFPSNFFVPVRNTLRPAPFWAKIVVRKINEE